MAKSSKLEDYWKEKNVESLLKDLTRTLVQRMPADPAVAVVEYLQRKFPRSFKRSTDDSQGNTIAARTLANRSQTQSMASSRSDVDAQSTKSLPAHDTEPVPRQADGGDQMPLQESIRTDLLDRHVRSGLLPARIEYISLSDSQHGSRTRSESTKSRLCQSARPTCYQTGKERSIAS